MAWWWGRGLTDGTGDAIGFLVISLVVELLVIVFALALRPLYLGL
jgi:hypothetical protein